MGVIAEYWKSFEKSIKLQTRLGSDISNYQSLEFSKQEENHFDHYRRTYPRCTYRTPPDSFYNCFGLVFASRRTGIYEDAMLGKILAEDGYKPINQFKEEVLPGDIIIYFSNDNDFRHAGIVIGWDNQVKRSKILSKWGKYCEVIHFSDECPYPHNIKYYRLQK